MNKPCWAEHLRLEGPRSALWFQGQAQSLVNGGPLRTLE